MMTDDTRRFVRMLLSAIVAGIMGAGSILLTSLTPEGAMKPGAILIAGITGIMFVCKDIQSCLMTPPQGPGGEAK